MYFSYPHPPTDMDDEPGLCPSQAMTNVYALLQRGREGGNEETGKEGQGRREVIHEYGSES